jgi:hypothetical protein
MLPFTPARLVPSPAPLTYRLPPSCRPACAPRSTLSSRTWPVAAAQRSPTLAGRSLSPTRSTRSCSAPLPASTAAPSRTGVPSPAVRSHVCDVVTQQPLTVRFHDTLTGPSTAFAPAATPGVARESPPFSWVTRGVAHESPPFSCVTRGVAHESPPFSRVTRGVARESPQHSRVTLPTARHHASLRTVRAPHSRPIRPEISHSASRSIRATTPPAR